MELKLFLKPMTFVGYRIMTCVSIVLDWGGKHITQR
jgi:hypothetical protein